MHRNALAFAVSVAALVAAQPATPLPPGRLHPSAPVTAHPLDASWSNRFGLPIRNGLARAITSYGGSVIVGGSFTQAGTTHARYVAAWDGSAWHALGTGTPGPVLALAVLGGHLFAAGGFTPASGFVAEWDGVAWSTLVTTSPPIRALAVFGGELHAGGDFNSIDGVAASCVARWDGSTWHALGAGITGPGTVSVSALAAYGTKLVAAGTFTDLQSIAAWDGVAWSGLGSGLQSSGGRGEVHALVAIGSDLVVVGKIDHAGATVTAGAARWDGASWSSLGSIIGSTQYGVGEWAGAPVTGAPVSGAVRPARWNGSSWVDDGSPPASAYALFNDGVSLYFGGVGSLDAPDGFLRYDGATWTPLQQAWAPGMSGLRGVPNSGPEVYDMVEHEGALYAAGNLSMAGAEDHFISVRSIARWDGVAWSSTPPTPSGSVVYTLSHYNGALAAAGADWVATLGPGGWTKLGGSFGGSTTALTQVGTDLVAVGYLPYFGLNGIGRWNGSSWIAVGAGFDVIGSDDIPYAVTGFGGGIVVGGQLTASGSTPLENLAFWNGTSWGDFGGGADGVVYALTPSGSDLLVGGVFTHVGGVEAHGVARWNGSSWSALGDNAEYVYRFREHGGRLFAVGEFEELDGSDVYGVAEWTGERWSTLGSGVVGEAFGLDFVGDELFIGGSFGWAYGRPSFNIASLPNISTLDAPAPPRVTRLALAAGPNPARGAMRFRLSLPNAAHVRLTVRDVSGRTVATLVDEVRRAGTSLAEWTSRAAPGVYLATVESGGERRSLRVIRLD